MLRESRFQSFVLVIDIFVGFFVVVCVCVLNFVCLRRDPVETPTTCSSSAGGWAYPGPPTLSPFHVAPAVSVARVSTPRAIPGVTTAALPDLQSSSALVPSGPGGDLRDPLSPQTLDFFSLDTDPAADPFNEDLAVPQMSTAAVAENSW